MTTRRELLVLLRARPGSTANDLARALTLSAAAVRRHLDNLATEGLVERVATKSSRLGRPPSGWRLSARGSEEFPRRYDTLALELLEDVAEAGGPEAVEALLARRTEKMAAQYEAELDGAADLPERLRRVAGLRDEAGYVAECLQGENGELLLVENNCAIHRVAQQHSAVCSMELVLLRRVLGPDVDVTRVSHALSGDAHCCYRVRPGPQEDGVGR